MSSSLSPLFAPAAYALGRVLKSGAINDWSRRLDPMFARAHLQTMGARGWDLLEAQRFSRVPQLLAAMEGDHSRLFRDSYSNSRSQLLQDLFVVAATGGKRNGYFVEIGVGDGENLSNSFLLERQYGWSGILVEPNIVFHDQIAKLRSAALDTRAAYRTSGESLAFQMNAAYHELSTLVDFDGRDQFQRAGDVVPVTTATIDDILRERAAPDFIDYMSIDTEGSEFAVLEGFDFSKRRVSVFTIESNYDKAKMEKIDKLMKANNYRKVLETVSYFDSWYVSNQIAEI